MRDFAAKPATSLKRLYSLAGVVVLHGLLFWAIHNGLAGKFVKAVQQTVVQAALIEEIKTSIPPPPPPPQQPKPSTQPKDTPTPVPQPAPNAAPPETLAAITATPVAAPSPNPPSLHTPTAPSTPAPTSPPAPAANPLEGVRTAISLVGNCAKPAYPEASRRNEEEGTTTISLTVAANNTVQSAVVVKSSGFPRLDEIARAAFMRCQYRAATLSGSPVTSSRQIPFVWSLDE